MQGDLHSLATAAFRHRQTKLQVTCDPNTHGQYLPKGETDLKTKKYVSADACHAMWKKPCHVWAERMRWLGVALCAKLNGCVWKLENPYVRYSSTQLSCALCFHLSAPLAYMYISSQDTYVTRMNIRSSLYTPCIYVYFLHEMHMWHLYIFSSISLPFR